MKGAQEIRELFLSRILNRLIVDARGAVVGRVRDMAIRWETPYPRVTGIKYAKDVQQHLGTDLIDQWDGKVLRLKHAQGEYPLLPLQEDELYVGKWLMDKQIIDLKGSKVVRVNDVKLAWINSEKNQEILLVAVDIGLRGLMRRVGLEFLVRKRPMHLVGWQYLKPLKTKTANLLLSLEQSQLDTLHPADFGDIIEDLDVDSRNQLLENLDAQTTAEVLVEADLDTRVEVINSMTSERAADILEEMPSDEAADILGELSEEKSSELLELMDQEEAQDVRDLMEYEEDTAGALMTTEFLAFPADMTAEATIDKLREMAPSAETIYYLYVLDSSEALQGVLSLRDLIVAPPSTILAEIMQTRVVTVKHYDDHRKVYEIVSKYDLLALPVVDDAGVLLGIITVDDAMDIVNINRSGLRNFMASSGPGWRR